MPLAVLEGQQQPDRSRVRTECVGAAQLSSWAAKLKTREAGLDEKPPEEAPQRRMHSDQIDHRSIQKRSTKSIDLESWRRRSGERGAAQPLSEDAA